MWNFLIQIGVALVLSAVSYALKSNKYAKPTASSLDDFDIPTAEEGRVIPVVFGTVLLTGANVVWAGDLKVTAIKKKGSKK
uniref:hypothetical protein n=1 Tax=Paenirhodobacter enshiensis TaxID=1105367 RepID=UPI0035B41C46